MNLTEQQVQELREKLSEFIEFNKKLSEAGQGWRVDHQMMWIRDNQAQYLLNALDENKALKERVKKLESILLSQPMADESTEQYIKNRLAVRGFTEKTITNNRGMIGAIIDEMELLNTNKS